jgi:hypothetical protein
VDGKQFVDAFSEALEPRLRLSGEMAVLDKFKAFFADRTMEKGTEVPFSVPEAILPGSTGRFICNRRPDAMAVLCRQTLWRF